jgi:hypothetical protein
MLFMIVLLVTTRAAIVEQDVRIRARAVFYKCS